MKKALLSLIAAAAMYLTPCNLAAEEPAVPVQIRSGAGTVYHRSLHEGESDLYKAAGSAHTEDFWAFYNGRWVDWGYNESCCSVEYVPLNIADSLRKLSPRGTMIINYHNHPADDIFPSDSDIYSHKSAKHVFGLRGLKLISRIATKNIIIEYGITPQLDNEFSIAKEGSEDSAAESKLSALWKEIEDFDDSQGPKACREFFESMAQRYRDAGVILSYRFRK